MKKLLLTLVLIFFKGVGLCAQQSFSLQFPVKCQLNRDCWIVNYVDKDPSSNWSDYENGKETYDGHTGVDVAIKDVGKMKQGVSVVAAADGFVIATRDGVIDKNALVQDKNKLQNIGCGNRVAIKHTGGWITDYCHMKQGSIKVKKGDFVSTGQTLGQIGMSGLTEFPHLHINVQQGEFFYDPFTGLERYKKGRVNKLWNPHITQNLMYKPLVVYNTGISTEIPKLSDIRDGKYDYNQIGFYSNMILVWVDMFHVEAGDYVDVMVKNQTGAPFIKQHIIIDKPNVKKLIYVGKKKPANGFAKGHYNVQISFKRPNTNICYSKTFSFIVR